jgi:hypothetical protein
VGLIWGALQFVFILQGVYKSRGISDVEVDLDFFKGFIKLLSGGNFIELVLELYQPLCFALEFVLAQNKLDGSLKFVVE